MVSPKCVKLLDYTPDWHILTPCLIPIFFGLLFPIYLFQICPLIWYPESSGLTTKSLIVGYWLFALIVWLIFLAICFYHLRNGNKDRFPMTCGMRTSDSTEDIWSEDKYLPEMYLPSPDFCVSITAIQPLVVSDDEHLEAKEEVDETWDYNFEEQQPNPKYSLEESSSLTKTSTTFHVNKETHKRKCSDSLKSIEPLESTVIDNQDPKLSNSSRYQPVKIQRTNESGEAKCSTVGDVTYLKLNNSDPKATKATQNDNAKPDGNANPSLERQDSIVSDAKFDLILESLQFLAVEIERDFHIESDTKSKFPAASLDKSSERLEPTYKK